MALMPIPRHLKLQRNGELRATGRKRLGAITTPKTNEVKYRRQLLALTNSIYEAVETKIYPLLLTLESDYTSDSDYSDTLIRALDAIESSYRDVTPYAQQTASAFVAGLNSTNKRRFYSSLENSVGVNMESVIKNEGLSDIVNSDIRTNVSLIKSIPPEQFNKIEQIIFTNVTQGTGASSIIKQLREAGASSNKRARFIARDQTAKINANLSQARAENLGAEEYIWRTAEDGRVRDSHRVKNGKIYRYDNPPSDTGRPASDYNCRCIAQPIIKV